MKNSKLHILVECAVLIALGTVLSLVKIFVLPLGGSITLLSMLPIVYIGFAHGPKWGFGSAFVYSIFQFILSRALSWGLTPLVLIVCILFDYIIAFTILGVTGFFPKSNRGLLVGTCLAMVLRFACHYFSGITIWASTVPEETSPYVYSLLYNGTFMLPELVFTVIGVMLIFNLPIFKKKLSK